MKPNVVELDDLPGCARIYVAGPMSNHQDDDWNFAAFQRASLMLRALGFIVVNPAEVDRVVWGFDGRMCVDPPAIMTRRRVLSMDVGVLLPTCDAIYMLRGWSTASGACYEWMGAMNYGMYIAYESGAERGMVVFTPEGDEV